MAEANEAAQDRQAQKRVEQCIEAMLVSTRHKPLAQELLKLLAREADERKARSSARTTIDI